MSLSGASVAISLVIALMSIFLCFLLYPEPFFLSNSKDNVKSRRVLITGASQGIGKALVEEYARIGVEMITIVSRNQNKLDAVRESIATLNPDVKVFTIAADLSTDITCKSVIDKALTMMGGIDVLLLNHITSSRYGTWLVDNANSDEGYSFIQEMFAVNTWSYIWLTTYAMNSLKENSGRIGIVSSLAAQVGTPKTTVYSSTKHALNGFFNAFRAELKLLNISNVSITICSIGATDTEGAADVKKIMKTVTFDPPSFAAKAIVRGVASRRRQIYHPHHLVFPTIIMYNFIPDIIDDLLIKINQ